LNWSMKWCYAIGLFVAALGNATEVTTSDSDPFSFDGKTPSQIEKIMIEEIFNAPKKGDKDKQAEFNFTKSVKPVLDEFKAQMLAEKKKQQAQLYADIATIKECIKKMQNSMKLSLLETGKKKKDPKKAKKLVKKCPTKKDVKKCKEKIKGLKPKQKACDELKKIGDKDIKSIHELIKKWNKQKVLQKDCKKDKGETTYHYVKRLAGHFKDKLAGFKKRADELIKKQNGGKALQKGCDAIEHYGRQLVEVTCEKVKVKNYACKCDQVIKEKKVCSSFDGCYEASVANYKTNRDIIEKKNAAAKLEWRAVGRIECLVKVMGGKNKADAKQLEKCIKGPQISTKPLDLIYPKIPSKPECKLKGLDETMRKKCASGAKGKGKGKAKGAKKEKAKEVKAKKAAPKPAKKR